MSTEIQEVKLEDFDLGTLEKILLKTKNDEAIKEVQSEINKIDQIADRLAGHASKLLDSMEEDTTSSRPTRLNTKSPNKVSHVYVSSQIANMISMKTLKLALLKHKNDLGTSSLDRAMKILTSLNKEEGGSRELPLHQVMSMLLSKNITIPTNSKFLDVIDMDESDIDAELDRVILENNIESIVNTTSLTNNENVDEVTETELIATKLFLDTTEEKIFLVDDDYTVIREVQEDEIDVIEINEGEYYCKNFNLALESDE